MGSLKGSSAGKWARVTLAILLAAILFYLASRGVSLADAWQVMRAMRWLEMSAALALTVLSPVVRAWRWQELYTQDAPGFWLLSRW